MRPTQRASSTRNEGRSSREGQARPSRSTVVELHRPPLPLGLGSAQVSSPHLRQPHSAATSAAASAASAAARLVLAPRVSLRTYQRRRDGQARGCAGGERMRGVGERRREGEREGGSAREEGPRCLRTCAASARGPAQRLAPDSNSSSIDGPTFIHDQARRKGWRHDRPGAHADRHLALGGVRGDHPRRRIADGHRAAHRVRRPAQRR